MELRLTPEQLAKQYAVLTDELQEGVSSLVRSSEHILVSRVSFTSNFIDLSIRCKSEDARGFLMAVVGHVIRSLEQQSGSSDEGCVWAAGLAYEILDGVTKRYAVQP
jgi:hypothetical protein